MPVTELYAFNLTCVILLAALYGVAYISIEPKDIELSDDILAFKLNYNRRKKPNFSEEKLNSLEKEKKDCLYECID